MCWNKAGFAAHRCLSPAASTLYFPIFQFPPTIFGLKLLKLPIIKCTLFLRPNFLSRKSFELEFKWIWPRSVNAVAPFFPLPCLFWAGDHSWITNDKSGFISCHFDPGFKGRGALCSYKRNTCTHTQSKSKVWCFLLSSWLCAVLFAN